MVMVVSVVTRTACAHVNLALWDNSVTRVSIGAGDHKIIVYHWTSNFIAEPEKSVV